MNAPKVSIIVPNYNHCLHLEERLDSILNQTFGDFELLVLDDASTDESHAVLVRYYAKPRIRIQVNTRNSGSAFPQWNRGIGIAKGEYIWIAESDDSADSRFLETLIPVLDANPDVGVAYCASKLINRESSIVGDSLHWTCDLHPTRWTSDYFNAGVDELKNYLIAKNTIPNASAVLARRTVLLQAIPVDTTFRLCGDWLHWGKMLLKSDVAYIAEGLNYWRIDSSNSRQSVPGILEWQEGKRILSHFARELGFTDLQTYELLLGHAERCFDWASSAVKDESAARLVNGAESAFEVSLS